MKRLCIPLLALSLVGCSTGSDWIGSVTSPGDSTQPRTTSLERPLQPVARPSPAELSSMTVTSLVDGATKTYAVQLYGNGIRVQESSGCSWTSAPDWFAPSDSYANCGTSKTWHTAQAQVHVLDSLYPLKVGSVGRYHRHAVSHNGKVSARETRCEVTDAVQVVRAGGVAVPAFVVVCDDGRLRRTTWYAPGDGPVAYREVHKRKGAVREAWLRAD